MWRCVTEYEIAWLMNIIIIIIIMHLYSAFYIKWSKAL
jgi:hypothetical protein